MHGKNYHACIEEISGCERLWGGVAPISPRELRITGGYMGILYHHFFFFKDVMHSPLYAHSSRANRSNLRVV